MKEFLTNEKWWRHRVIAAGVVVVLLYGLLVVATGGVTGTYRSYSYNCYGVDCDNIVEVCSGGSPRAEVFPVIFVWVLAEPMFDRAGLSYNIVPSSNFVVHISNATFYFLTAVWFSGLYMRGRRSRRRVALGCFYLCGFLYVLLFCCICWWLGYSWSFCYQSY